jgi:S-formylglutathione hydrolase FrmB
MRIRKLLALSLLGVLSQSFTDVVHYSKQFGRERSFRVFTPLGYDPRDTLTKYPVIYFFHGCRGTYYKSGLDSYADAETVPPSLPGREHCPDYNVPYNADFERYSDVNNVIIVAVDGKIPGYDEEGCGVYYPFHHEPEWKENDYNFSLYIREVFGVVDSLYNTIPGPQGKAISGLSYGGHSSMWVSAANPHLIRSCSQFGHSPHNYRAGPPPVTTALNVQELWRNFRDLPFRGSTNTLDYLRDFSENTAAIYDGAGFESEFHLADFCRHYAADIPQQFEFHMKHFQTPKTIPECFSHINFYPDFDA